MESTNNVSHGHSIDNLVTHALNTLPDSISSRKVLLQAVRNSIKPKHPQYKRVVLMLRLMEQLELEQEQLHLWQVNNPLPKEGGNNDH